MSVEELAKMCKASEEKVRSALQSLKQKYEDSGTSLLIMDEGDHWKLTVREKFLPLVQNIVTETELPKTVIETLAIIAFKHPILQAEVIKIRSNKAYEHVALLEEAGYITREKFGRTRKIRLAPKFFEYFDLPPEKVREAFAGFEAVEKAILEKEKSLEEAKLEVYKEEGQEVAADLSGAAPAVEPVDPAEPAEEPEKHEEPGMPPEEPAEEPVTEPKHPVIEEPPEEHPQTLEPEEVIERHIPPQPLNEDRQVQPETEPQGGELPPALETADTVAAEVVQEQEKPGTDGIEVFLPEEHEKEEEQPKEEEPEEQEPEEGDEEPKDEIEDIIEKKADAIMQGRQVKESKREKKDALDVAYDQIEEDKEDLRGKPE